MFFAGSGLGGDVKSGQRDWPKAQLSYLADV
jgi:hypothetical protein